MVLNNITFVNANCMVGGAVHWSGNNGSLTNCNFNNNLANIGGGIFLNKSDVSISDSKFTNCHASFGGAIVDLNSKTTIYNTTFENNTAVWDGGAIYKMYLSLSIDNLNFINNSANRGEAIFIDDAVANFKNSNFTNNSIYSIRITNEFDNLTFVNSSHSENNVSLNIGNDNYAMINYPVQKYNGTLPSFYNSTYIIPVKDQGSNENCWAFAALSTLEANILKATNVTYDFSENNMKNLMALFSDYGWNIDTNMGGYTWMPISYFTSWLGPVDEKDDEYVLDSLISPVLNSTFHIQNILFIKQRNLSEIKNAIMTYGAVSCHLNYNEKYLASDGVSYYYNSNVNTNHVVTLVGWDDNYSQDNFNIKPSSDGAFIVKNSWGEDWGNNGYFYVSYHDQTLAKSEDGISAYAFVLNDTVHYNKNYQYDIPGRVDTFSSTLGDVWGKNIFTSSDDDLLAAFSTYFEDNSDYNASIYVNGELKLRQLGHVSNGGYYTIPLDKYIPLKKGDVFEILLNLPVLYYCEDSWTVKSFSSPGISYFGWSEQYLHDYSNERKVACIKAFTVNRINTTITLSDTNFKINTPFEINASIHDSFNEPALEGNVTLNINNKSYSSQLNDGVATFNVTVNETGIKNVSFDFSALSFYNPSTLTAALNITKNDADINVSISNITYGSEFKVNITFKGNVTGNISVSVGEDKSKDIVLNLSKAFETFDELDAGNYTLTVSYLGDDNYNSLESSYNFTVSKANITALNFNISPDTLIYNQKITFTPVIDDNVAGNISFFDEETLIATINITGSLTISNLTAGSHNITVRYNGDENHNSSENSTVINVDKAEAIFKIIINDTVYPNTVKGVLITDVNATYDVFIENYPNIPVTAAGNLTEFTIGLLSAGNDYEAIVSINESTNYKSSANRAVFSVNSAETSLNISNVPSNPVYGENVTLDYNITEGATGTIELTENDVVIATVNVGNQIILSDLAAGSHEITVKYINDTLNYSPAQTSVSFNVLKAECSLNMSIDDVTYPDNITVNVNASVDGVYNININSTIIKVHVVDSTGSATVALDAGIYKAAASFNNTNYTLDSSDIVFNVNKGLNNLYLLMNNETYPKEIEVVLRTTLPNGTYVVRINSTEVTVEVKESLGVTRTLLDAGFYKATVNFTNPNYEYSENSDTFTVFKGTNNLNLKIDDSTYPQNTTVHLTAGIDGVYEVKINSTTLNITVNNGEGSNTTKLNAGTYNASVSFTDPNYNDAYTEKIFDVAKATNNLNLEIDDSTYPQNTTVRLTAGVDGIYEVIINSTTLNITVNNGEGSNTIKLDAGSYNASVSFTDSNYNDAYAEKTFAVEKTTSKVSINPISNISYGENATIEFSVLNETTVRFVLENSSGEILYNYTTDLKTLKISNLNADTYKVTVINDESANYLKSSDVKTFNVNKATSEVKISPIEDAVYLNDVTVNFDVINRTKVHVMVINTNTREIVLNETATSSTVTLNKLNAGKYTVVVTNDESEKYLSGSDTREFNVLKANSTIIVKATVNSNSVNVSFDKTNVRIVISNSAGVYYNRTVTQNYVNIYSIPSDNYTVEVYYSGDSNYLASSNTTKFTIPKLNTSVTIYLNNIDYGEDAHINFIVSGASTGQVNVTVSNGNVKESKTANVRDVQVIFKNLTTGNYTVTVEYLGDENHNKSQSQSYFTVSKVNAWLSVTSNRARINEIVNIKINITGGATGIVSVYADDVFKGNLTFKDSSAQISFKAESVKNHILSLTYYGDDKYKPTTFKTTFRVDKGIANLTVTPENITLGDVEHIKINVPQNYDGILLIDVANQHYYKIPENGSATLEIDNLASGQYDVFVRGVNSNSYEDINSTATFTVFRISNYQMSASVENNDSNENLVFKITLPSDAGGNYTVSIQNKNYTSSIKNSIEAPKLGNGVYTYTVTYLGDSKYDVKSQTVSVTINNTVVIKVSDLEKYYGDSKRLVIVIENEKSQRLANKQIQITINNRTYNRTTDENGSASMAVGLSSGVYDTKVKFVSDGKYASIATNITVTIKTTITGNDLTKMYRNQTQYYATFVDSQGNLLKDATVTFNINGVFYERKSNGSGVARLNINLEQGEYIITAINPSTYEMHSNIVKVLPLISENRDVVKYYRNATQYVIKLLDSTGKPVSAGENVTFNINGIFYVRTANSTGHVKLNLNLQTGNYIITAEYKGCKVSNKIQILSVLSADNLVMKYRDGSQFKASLLNGQGKPLSGETVEFNVNGVFYKRISGDDGIARLNINLMAGEYIITSSYNGLNAANTITITS